MDRPNLSPTEFEQAIRDADLTADQAIVVFLHLRHKMSLPNIAHHLQWTLHTVQQRETEARLRLRAALDRACKRAPH